MLEVDRAALAAGYGPAPFWNDQGRRLTLGQLRMLIGFTAHDLQVGKSAEARRHLADLKAVLASPAIVLILGSQQGHLWCPRSEPDADADTRALEELAADWRVEL